MNILLIGSGGREHALALKLKESKQIEALFIAPGNAGTAMLGKNINIQADDIDGICNFAFENSIDMVVVGPEVPLSLGIADELELKSKTTGKKIYCFGPTREASQLESSKVFAKNLMSKLEIPTARYRSFKNFTEAVDWINNIDYEFVIKLSGLAAGKGVFLPNSKEEGIGILYSIMNTSNDDIEIVIEERLFGEEVSILAFTDGKTISIMPSCQDHKRIGNNDTGLNTGGMGAYAPATICPGDKSTMIAEKVILPIIKHMEKSNNLYSGVIYAGVILTKDGPKVLEYNCRFGDPETQVLMQLLDSDLIEIILSCCNGTLHNVKPKWKNEYAGTVVMAKQGYPEKQVDDVKLNSKQLVEENNVYVIHSGTIQKDGELYAHGGRVLSVTSSDKSLAECMHKIYAKIDTIDFPLCKYRTDIALKGINFMNNKTDDKSLAYSSAGVDIDAGNRAVKLMGEAVKQTYTPAVLSKLGSFGGLFDTAEILTMNKPILVGSTDGVGTKVKLAAEVNRYESIGMDIVNHCIDDILVQGAKPLFFLDYFATSKLNPQMAAEIVMGMSKACKESGCVLIGGETAEMPGVYMPGEFDIAGTIVGVVEHDKLLPKANIQSGDILVGLASNSPHTNGYSLIRKVFENYSLSKIYEELGCSLSDALLKPHRSYLNVIYPILQQHPEIIKGLAHITGGGFIENIPRVLPNGLNAIINKKAWEIPPLYKMIQQVGNIDANEMYRIFNMGVGLIAIISPDKVDDFRKHIGEDSWIIGSLKNAYTVESEPKTILE